MLAALQLGVLGARFKAALSRDTHTVNFSSELIWETMWGLLIQKRVPMAISQ
jgi:hypothetical protein